MRQFKVLYINFKNEIKQVFVTADDFRDAEITVKNMQGLKSVVHITEIEEGDQDG